MGVSVIITILTKMMSRLVCFILYSILVGFPIQGFSQQARIWDCLVHGRYDETIRLCDSVLQNGSVYERHEVLGMKSRALLYSYKLEEYLGTIRIAAKYDPIPERAEILLSLRTSEYYQYSLATDSTIHFAIKAMGLYRDTPSVLNDSLKSYLYATFGNSMRNGQKVDAYLKVHHNESELRNRYLMSYLDTALMYAVNDEQRADIYTKAGTLYSDRVWEYPKLRTTQLEGFSDVSIQYLNKAISLFHNPTKIAHAYALIGLNYHYLLQFNEAEDTFEYAMSVLKSEGVIQSLEELLSITNWRGRNFEFWHEYEGDIRHLIKADSLYRSSLDAWYQLVTRSGQNGMNDGFRISPTNKLAATNSMLFKETGDTTYLSEAFKFCDWSKYATLDIETTSLSQLQECLNDSQLFVQWFMRIEPKVNMAFVITRSKFFLVKTGRADCSGRRFQNLNGSLGLNKFKESSYFTYGRYFASVDSVIKSLGIKQLILSNYDECSWLNLDVLISDTLATSWKDQPYLFKRYQISYALSARSFVDSYRNKTATNSGGFGVSIGKYDNEATLRFSEDLTQKLENDYILERVGFRGNIEQSRVALCFSHGQGALSERQSYLLTSTNDTLRVSEIFDMKLDNDFVMLTACNTNTSTQYRSEGAVGNFSKALRYAGALSTLTTSWQIDERSNSLIIERFLFHLSNGVDKSKALWMAKQDYWNQCETDEEFNPLYWASYVLTGNINPVEIQKKQRFDKNWLWLLLLIPVGVAGWKKFS